MIKGKSVIGRPVLSYDSGKRLGMVREALLEPEQRRVLAFLVDGRDWNGETRAIPFGSVKAVGRDAVIVPNEQAIVHVSEVREIEAALTSRTTITGLRMFTEDGRDIGIIEDVYFDAPTGEVKGFEVSGGLLTRVRRGRLFVPLPSSLRIGEEFVFVPSETGTRVEEVEEGIGPTLEDMRTTSEELLRRVSEELDRLREVALKASVEQQRKFVIGKVADRSVFAPDGSSIVQQGEVIDEQAAAEAEMKGVLREMVLAAGTSVAKNTFDRLRDETVRAFGEARRTIERQRAARRGKEEGEEVSEENVPRENRALGRPVTRVVFDQDERVILNAGDIVTHESIERARQAGMLEDLLSAVSKEEPRFSAEERRAHTPGEMRAKRAEEVEEREIED
ncbi:MAG: PRC-barrel domain-containing protein [Chloroflexi bacterium]|nr:PRC-barrel domain-containing protein [Chloroflexota bacterium]